MIDISSKSLKRFFFAHASSTDVLAMVIIGIILIARLVYILFLGLIPDETYYWDWSRELSFGYFDHPPMIAWIIHLSTTVFGLTNLGVRSGVLVASSLASVFSYFLAKQYIKNEKALLFFLIVSNSILLFGIGTLLATPDIPLMLFWSSSLLLAYFAIFKGNSLSWILLGVSSGFGLLSKYTFILFFVALFLFLIFSKQQRKWFTQWQTYAAMAISFLLFIPNLIWNSQHSWVSFAFQFAHGVNSRTSLNWDSFGEFIGGQAGVMSGFVFVVLFIALFRLWKSALTDDRIAYIVWFFCVPFGVFLAASLQKSVEANWAATSYVAGLLLIGILWDTLDNKRNKLLRQFMMFAVGFAMVTTIVVLIHLQIPFLPLPPGNDPASQSRGWKGFADHVEKIRLSLDPNHSLGVCANRYQEASMLGFFLPDHPKTTSLNIHARPNTYALFPSRKSISAGSFIFVLPSQDPIDGPEFSHTFASIENRGQAVLQYSKKQATIYNVYLARLQKHL